MQSSLNESVQQAVRPGVCVDLYYPDPETAKKQCFRTSQNNRYIQGFNNLTGGSNTLTIPPNNGVQDIIVRLVMPAVSSNSGLALPVGWGYGLIKQVSFRYGGSSQYFLTGQQILQNALRMSPNGTARNDLLTLGGVAATGSTLASSQEAYVWLSLPHCTPSAEGKLPPLPTDLLTQQVQITCELYPIATIFSVSTGTSPAVPTSLSSGSFSVQQVQFHNQGDALARRVDMTSHALSYPVEFVQQQVSIPLGSVAASSSQAVSLTGFRSGEVKSIQVWLSADSDTHYTGGTPTAGTISNPFRWFCPRDLVMTYAGEVYARYEGGASQLWNLVNGRQTPSITAGLIADVSAGNPSITSTSLSQWAELPFAQSYDDLTAHSTYLAGMPITNGIVQLAFTMPPGIATTPYTLNVSYVYNSVLAFSQGTCDYVF